MKEGKRKPKKSKKRAAKPAGALEKRAQKAVAQKAAKYFQALGRRKTSVARVRLWTRGDGKFLINGKPLEAYFPLSELRQQVLAPLTEMGSEDKFTISALVKGGGFRGQAEALRHGLARALVFFNADFRKRLKKAGFLTRDPRMRERKKFGLKRARRAPQWAKR
ncbi:MAG: small subunit ribosomal protein S9 [Parcubacteria group bacterium Gr01-1014_30]|nr:MAG: small subunit ribosomal protein S9 [Parcubacteria group bacterium Gr01-1014_30]